MTKIEKIKHRLTHMDHALFATIIFLLCFGLVMLYSTSAYSSYLEQGRSTWYLEKQIISTLLGVGVMILFMVVDYHFWKKFLVIAYFGSLVLVAMVLTPLGIEANGARRWINLGFSVQPAEIVKVAVIFLLAVLIANNVRTIGKFSKLVIIAIPAMIAAVAVAVFTSNLSSAIIIVGITFTMLFVASPKYKHFIVMIVLVVVAVVLFLNFGDGFRMSRIEVWKNPEAYSQEGGYQVLQALYAIGSGGLFGKGFGQSVQKLGFVPEAQNDMIFTIICEELGLFGGIAILILFGFMIWRLYVIAMKAKDLLGSMLAVGVMAHIAIQVILNIAVVTNTIPNTGITLPFISYGGSSVLFLLAEMGLVLSVSSEK